MTNTEAARAWREIEGRLRPFVARRVASPADVDDVIQDVFVRLSRGLSDLRDEERLLPWLFTIARHAVIDHHRAVARARIARVEVPEMPVEEHDEAGERLLAELSTCVARFVTELPASYRDAVTLVELEGVPAKEAAKRLGLSHSGLKSRVQRGRARLRRRFDDACAVSLDVRRRVTECEPRGCGCGGNDT